MAFRFTSRRIETLPDFGRNYMRHVIAEYRMSPPDDKLVPLALKAVFERFDNQPDDLTWADLFLLEKFILSNQKGSVLKRRTWFLRDKYRELAGTRSYDAYLLSAPPNENAPNLDEGDLRADLDRLLAALHWSYSLTPIRERIRTGIARSTSFLLGCWLVLVCGLVWLFASQGETLIATLLLIMLFGAIGGFVSLQRRVSNVPSDGDPLVSILQLENASASAYLAPLSGAIFAVLLYVIFLGKLVGGTIFPEVTAFNFYLGTVGWTSPLGADPVTQYGKLLVWSFIAGFAERFVPDALDRLVTRGQQSMTGSSASSTVVVSGSGTGDGMPPKKKGDQSQSGDEDKSKDNELEEQGGKKSALEEQK
jgi:hypothetical protein